MVEDPPSFQHIWLSEVALLHWDNMAECGGSFLMLVGRFLSTFHQRGATLRLFSSPSTFAQAIIHVSTSAGKTSTASV